MLKLLKLQVLVKLLDLLKLLKLVELLELLKLLKLVELLELLELLKVLKPQELTVPLLALIRSSCELSGLAKKKKNQHFQLCFDTTCHHNELQSICLCLFFFFSFF